ncbi:hypothetical protein FJR41_012560 [Dolichospermum planctonicum UHCC 0167]|jgi:hypothetical protein|uniref:hypothetical protein n=1 Tax=Dolichospermum planctonicum TaxID=136072 RepID=UPI0014431612|nr:hypothetical protein [Dolichospermum planctonicum]MCW9681614.1 hypothetical protein [Dolichospermum planctonicum UHCC 0167]
MNSKKVIRVTKTEFELQDGTIHPHAVELDEVSTPEEFQVYYDHWFAIFEEMTNGRQVIDTRAGLCGA